MKPLIIAFLAALALSGCHRQDHAVSSTRHRDTSADGPAKVIDHTSSADKFDLICDGEETLATVRDHTRIRIDLKNKLFCIDSMWAEGFYNSRSTGRIPLPPTGCRNIGRIRDVLPDKVILPGTLFPGLVDPTDSDAMYISRVDMSYYFQRKDYGIVENGIVEKGSCKLAPFGGFPKAKF